MPVCSRSANSLNFSLLTGNDLMLPGRALWNRPRSHGGDRCVGWPLAPLFKQTGRPPQPGEKTVGSITEKVNRLRIEAGEKPFKPRKVGAILKNLGVKTAS